MVQQAGFQTCRVRIIGSKCQKLQELQDINVKTTNKLGIT